MTSGMTIITTKTIFLRIIAYTLKKYLNKWKKRNPLLWISLEFFQTEKVEDKKIPVTLKLYFVDEEGSRISNENIVIADSRSTKPEDRTYREKFTLKDQAYDKAKKYYLVMEDENETIEKIYDKIPLMVDLSIINDFGF